MAIVAKKDSQQIKQIKRINLVGWASDHQKILLSETRKARNIEEHERGREHGRAPTILSDFRLLDFQTYFTNITFLADD